MTAHGVFFSVSADIKSHGIVRPVSHHLMLHPSVEAVGLASLGRASMP